MTTCLVSFPTRKRPGTRAITKYLPAVCMAMAKPGQFHAKCDYSINNSEFNRRFQFSSGLQWIGSIGARTSRASIEACDVNVEFNVLSG